jgi:antitoxin PrlF
MSYAKVTSKGQITVPVEVRQAMKLEAGDRVLFVRDDDSWRLIPANSPASALKGFIPKPDKPVSLEEIEEAIRQGWSRRFRVLDEPQ